MQLRLVVLTSLAFQVCSCGSPLVINTWRFTEATKTAWEFVRNGHTSIEAIEAGCSVCEVLQCDFTVGYGGSPDESGETTLDAMIFDGKLMNAGGVGNLRRIKSPISVARHVLENTKHTLLVGDQATEFAVEMGFKEEDLSTNLSLKVWNEWRQTQCQPNFWKNVVPDPNKSCGPYTPLSENSVYFKEYNHNLHHKDHDTIGMVALDTFNNLAAGTSTNGLKHKIPGRVGDSPVPGAGAYADNSAGAACATGDGDVMLRFLPSFLAVEEMRRGTTPEMAADIAIRRIAAHYPDFSGAVIAVNISGAYGAACNGMPEFPYSVLNNDAKQVTVKTQSCI